MANMIRQYQVGIPYQENAEKTAELILSSLDGECLQMRQRCRDLFEAQFSFSCFEKDFQQGLSGTSIGE